MLRRHFMTGTELPDFIITYHAPEHIPFWCGMKKRDINSVLNYGNGVLEDGTDGFKTPIIFNIVLDKWRDGVGEWGIKIQNTPLMSYYSNIQEGSSDNPESMKLGTSDYYIDLLNSNENYVNKITDIIFPEGLTHINGSPIYNANKNTSCLNITLPDSIEYLTGNLFGNYDSLKSITVPSNVKRIDNLCYVCSGNDNNSNLSLEEVILKPVTPPDASNSQFDDPLGTYYADQVYNNLKIRVYADSINTYKNDSIWGQYSDLYDTINNVIVYYTEDGNRNIYEQNDIITNTSNITGEIRLLATSIYLPNSVTTLSLNYYLKLKEFVIPNSVTNLNSISNCNALEKLTINNNIINATSGAISNCSNLTTIVFNNDNILLSDVISHFMHEQIKNIIIGSSVTNIQHDSEIRWFENLISIIIDNNNLIYDSREQCNAIIHTATNTLIKGCNRTTIPNSVTSIREYAFYICRILASITIPDGLTSIGKHAFYGCNSLTSLTIPNSVTNIGTNAFIGCYLTQDNFINNSSLDTEANNYWGATIVDSDVDGILIKDNAVITRRPNITLGAILIPNGVISINLSAFSGCKSLTSIVIPDSVISIGGYAFSECSSLTSVVIGNGVTSIGHRAFEFCDSLTSITIPNSMTSFETEIFYACHSLTSITFEGTIEQWNAVSKGSNWHYLVPATVVHCTDGDVAI